MITAILHSKSAIRLLPLNLQVRALDAYASSLSTVWVVSGCLAIVTLISALFIQEKELPGRVSQDVKSTGGGAGEGDLERGRVFATIEGETRDSI